MKTALVTGAAGFIGTALCRRLLAEEWYVYGCDIVPDLPPGVHRVGWEVENSIWWKHMRPPNVIFHLASIVGPVGVLGKRGFIVQPMAEGMDEILRHAPIDCRIVFTSTSEVYGEHEGRPVTEDASLVFGPANSARQEYALGKLICETMLKNLHYDHMIVRLFNAAGPGQDAEKGFVLPRWIEQIRKGEPLTLYAPGTQRRTFTHVEDVIDGLMRLATLEGGPDLPRLYNLGNPANETSLCEFMDTVLRVTGAECGYRMVDPRDLHGKHFREAPDKLPAPSLLEQYGWKPWRTLEQIVEDAIGVRP